MNSAALSLKMHSRPVAILMIVAAALYVAFTGSVQDPFVGDPDQGLALPAPSVWPLPAWMRIGANVGLLVLIMVLMTAINRTYNVLRALTRLDLGLFALMIGSVPRDVLVLNSGSMLCLSLAAALYLLFGCYEQPDRVRTVFAAFFLLSWGTTIQYCFAFFIPVLWVILIQMRMFTLRTFLASLMGMATVWILLMGFGIVAPQDIRLPDIVNVFNLVEPRTALYLLGVAGLTALLLVVSLLLNVMKTIAYNARARAYNGALTVLAFFTIVACAFDFGNILTYMPLLCFCSAYQITHYFVNHRYERQYIAVLVVVFLYLILYLWRLVL